MGILSNLKISTGEVFFTDSLYAVLGAVCGKDREAASKMTPAELSAMVKEKQEILSDTDFIEKISKIDESTLLSAFHAGMLLKITESPEWEKVPAEHPLRATIKKSVGEKAIKASDTLSVASLEGDIKKLILKTDMTEAEKTAALLEAERHGIEFDELTSGIKTEKDFDNFQTKNVKGNWTAENANEVSSDAADNILGLCTPGKEKEFVSMLGGFARTNMNIKGVEDKGAVEMINAEARATTFNMLMTTKANRVFKDESTANKKAIGKQMHDPRVTEQEKSVMQTLFQSAIKSGKTAVGIALAIKVGTEIAKQCGETAAEFATGGGLSLGIAGVMTIKAFWKDYKAEKAWAEKESKRTGKKVEINKLRLAGGAVLQGAPYALSFLPGGEQLGTAAITAIRGGAMGLKSMVQEAIKLSRTPDGQGKSILARLKMVWKDDKAKATIAGGVVAGLLAAPAVEFTSDMVSSGADAASEFIDGRVEEDLTDAPKPPTAPTEAEMEAIKEQIKNMSEEDYQDVVDTAEATAAYRDELLTKPEMGYEKVSAEDKEFRDMKENIDEVLAKQETAPKAHAPAKAAAPVVNEPVKESGDTNTQEPREPRGHSPRDPKSYGILKDYEKEIGAVEDMQKGTETQETERTGGQSRPSSYDRGAAPRGVDPGGHGGSSGHMQTAEGARHADAERAAAEAEHAKPGWYTPPTLDEIPEAENPNITPEQREVLDKIFEDSLKDMKDFGTTGGVVNTEGTTVDPKTGEFTVRTRVADTPGVGRSTNYSFAQQEAHSNALSDAVRNECAITEVTPDGHKITTFSGHVVGNKTVVCDFPPPEQER